MHSHHVPSNRSRQRSAPRRLARHRLPLALAAALAAPFAYAQVPPSDGQLPTGGSVVNGTASITLPGGNTMNITQTTQGAIINWGGFSIGNAATVNFVQPGATGVTLNRVVGNTDGIPLSQIFGGLNANGSVFIVNPSGVLFGNGAQVNVGGLVASTLSIADADFNAGVASGSFAFGQAAEDPTGNVTVQSGASLTAASGGTLALLGNRNIANGGALAAPRGSAILAQGRQVTLDFFGDGLTQVTLNSSENAGSFLSLGNESSGVIQADGGQVVLVSNTGDLSSGSGNLTIFNDGQIRARTLENRQGRIVLSASDGFVDVGGTLDATGTAAGQQGGTIEIEGVSVQISGSSFDDAGCGSAESSCTTIDASGHSGGGAIAITSTVGTDVTGVSGDDETTAVEIRSDALAAGSGGTVTFANDGTPLPGGSPGGINLLGTVLVSASGAGTASGGEIRLVSSGGEINLDDAFGPTGNIFVGPVDMITSGASGGGTIEIDAAISLNTAAGTLLRADATGSGTGGLVRTVSGDVLDLRGIDVAAGGPAGAGSWEIQSGRGLAIVPEADEFGGNVSLVSDDSIGSALSAGTDVDIVVPAPATGTAQINIAPGVAIANTGTLPVALSLTVGQGQVLAGIGAEGDPSGPWSVTSSAGPLDLSIDALSSIGLFQSTVQTGGGAINLISRDNLATGVFDAGILFDGTLDSGGGDISMTSLASQAAGIRIDTFSTIDTGGGDLVMTSEFSQFTGIQMDATTINTDGGALTLRALDSGGAGVDLNFSNTLDTRVAQNPANAGGAILIEGNSRGEEGGGLGVVMRNSDLRGSTGDITIIGRADGSSFNPFIRAAGVLVDSGGEIISTSGNIDITGSTIAGDGAGVLLTGNIFGSLGVLSTDSGGVSILGIGSTGGTTFAGGDGVVTLGYSILSGGGNILISGHGAADGTDAAGSPVLGNGVELGGTTTIASGGDILLSGSSEGSGAGIFVSGPGDGTDAADIDAGAGNIVLRAGNDGSAAALQIEGGVSTAGIVDLRAGEVTAVGDVLDRNASTLQIGGGPGEFVSMDSIANIDTPDLVIGHAGHAGAIAIAEVLTRAGNVTLQNTGGAGGIALNGAVNLGTGTLALVSGGDITQTASGAITAQSLLARSTGGSVDLTTAQNDVSGSTLAGGAADDFGYIDVNALTISDVAARGFDAAGQAATDLVESGIDAGDAVFVRNSAGDLTLGADVSGTDVDLVTAGRLQNVANATISAGNRWRVWADTWIGEQRGGLAGSGALPNLFNCSFGGPCGVTVSAAEDHFIYRAQPTATIDIASFTREYGLDNPALLFTVSGLILGDQQANAILGAPSTTAVLDSDVGSYPIAGSFTSPAGYAIQIDPGIAAITPATLTLVADPFSRIYGDPNGLFTGTVLGFRAGDTLADLAGALAFGTDATQGSDVGSYGIFGSGLSSPNYSIVNAAGNTTALTITPATLTYVADPFALLFGQLFGPFTGTVTGFRNGDTLGGDTTGTLLFSTNVDAGAPPGVYPIFGSGLEALNYRFVQDPANLTALRVDFAPLTQVQDPIRESIDTYVYDRNIGQAPMCLATGPLDGIRKDQAGDALGREWSKVRSRPNLSSCVNSERKNGCGDF